MRIAISADGDTLESSVDQRFGRCRYFLLVEVLDGKVSGVQAFQNSGAQHGHGAGIAAAQQVAGLSPDRVITGRIGPNAFRVLNQTSIKLYSSAGRAEDAVRLLLEDRLPPLTTFGRGRHGGRWRGQ